MGQVDDPPIESDEALPAPRRRRWLVALAAVAGLLVLAVALAWGTRERIAGLVITSQLESLGVPARYRIESIGPRSQVLANVVIGDPAHPDLTIDRVEIRLVVQIGSPAIDRLTLVRPRLYGRWRGGRLSFGTLDKVLFGGKRKEPFRLPDMNLALVDGRGLLESDYGPVGVKLEGRGRLRGGFAGTFAAVAPQAELGGCRAERATVYGPVKVADGKPRFTGPLRLARLACAQHGLALADAGVKLDATLDRSLDGVDGKANMRSGALAYGDNRASGIAGTLRFTWRNQALTAYYDLTGRALETPQAAASLLSATGALHRNAGRLEIEGETIGSGIRLGRRFDDMLAQAQRTGAGTFAAPLVGQIRSALLREERESRLAASYILRRASGATSLIVPQAGLRGGSGAMLVSLSRFQFGAADGAPPRLAGNFATRGPGLPQITGRLERRPDGALVTRMTLAEYRAADAGIAVPRLALVMLPDGALGFSGEARLSGALPGGRAENLALPIEGNWSAARGLALWRACATLRFDRLALANLSFDHRALSLCPPRTGAIVASDTRGTRIAAGLSALDLAGRLGTTPIRLRSGPVGFAMPGTLAARSLEVALGPAATASHFRIGNLDARLGKDVAGRFERSDVRLSAVRFDILDAAGEWRYAKGRLLLAKGNFRFADREINERFRPLVARDGVVELAGNRITATATLREPKSAREIVHVAVRHDLGTGKGSADLAVTGIVFDDQLQPDTLSGLALGVIANTHGTVGGTGRIDWTPEGITSSGRFTTDGLDFAAAFGPVKGASGTLVFTDLLGLVSAPDQQIKIASINPGIEVDDGVLTYELRPASVLAVKAGAWPFLDGKLTLLPVTMRMGVAEERHYTLVIDGLNAARLVERMELANLAATGLFDGTLPLVFDENGGRIEGGVLRSRPPGGSLSYVGALTYKDLSPMANFAFDALKSLDYSQMSIGMHGPLQGEIITRVQFSGIRQGATAKRNFLTDRIAKLPIHFNVNLRAPFFQLASSFRSLYDPAYIRDPRTLGLIDASGKPITPSLPKDAKAIQPRESGKTP
jgi:hypothetical protein